MADDLNLTYGDPDEADRIAAAGLGKVRATRQKTSDSDSGTRKSRRSSSSASKSTSSKSESALAARLTDAFARLADQLETKGDTELAAAIAEEKNGMTKGILSVTRPFPFFRSPFLFLLGIAESVLAFWRVGGILLRRFIAWRIRRVTEKQAEQHNYPTEPEPEPDYLK